MPTFSDPDSLPTYVHPTYPLPDTQCAPTEQVDLVNEVTRQMRECLGREHHWLLDAPDFGELCPIVVEAMRIPAVAWQYVDFPWLLIRFATMVKSLQPEIVEGDFLAWAVNTVLEGGIPPYKCMTHPNDTIRMASMPYVGRSGNR